VQNQAKP